MAHIYIKEVYIVFVFHTTTIPPKESTMLLGAILWICHTKLQDGHHMTYQTETQESRDILMRMERSLREINAKLAVLIKTQSAKKSIEGSIVDAALDVETLLSLPDHLRKSAMTVSEFGEATAQQVARKTGRSRAAESDYLNQLVTMNLLKKKRKGRDVYFSPGE